eukprot:6926673-Pyramimonas_sp.AAC.1
MNPRSVRDLPGLTEAEQNIDAVGGAAHFRTLMNMNNVPPCPTGHIVALVVVSKRCHTIERVMQLSDED